VAIHKSFAARKPLTRVRLTAAGRKAFVAYLDSIAKFD
jgi:Winged helix DNA-binding domain